MGVAFFEHASAATKLRRREMGFSVTQQLCKRVPMVNDAETAGSPDVLLATAGFELGQAILGAIEQWSERHAVALGGPSLAAMGRAAGAEIGARIAPQLVELLAADVDAQRGTPLTILRSAHRPLTEMLCAHGVVAASRDPSDVAAQPEDVYGLGPRSFADLGPEVHEAGIRWGVTKAFAHRARHQR